jgi:hypothetical protein
MENNVVYRTKTGGFHQHYGRDNVLRNNVFAFAKQGQLQRTRDENHVSFVFERNIVLWQDAPLFHGNWGGVNHYRLEQNLYWRLDAKPVDFAGKKLADWQAAGQDKGSLIADPQCRDPLKGDFTLAPTSPALKLGFQPIDLSTVGPRKENRP